MAFRVPAPDGRKEEGMPVLVLPENTTIRGYKVNYMTCGGMSVIYKAHKDNKKYVIKEVSGADSRNVMSLIQEKAVLERLNHPGIMQVFDLFDEDGFYYMVSEFVSGVTSDRKLPPSDSDRFLAESVVRDWAFQIFDIFEYLHNQTPPVIYRDLKPKNIMVNDEGRIKLIDFGIARTYKEGRTQDTEHMGSMVTASPEHYGAQTDARSDIYTIGATLHYLLSNGKTMECNAFDIPSVKLFNKQVTDQFASVIDKALELSPDKRFQSVAEMRAALKGEPYPPIRPAEPVVIPAPPPPAPPLEPPTASRDELIEESRPTSRRLPKIESARDGRRSDILIPKIPEFDIAADSQLVSGRAASPPPPRREERSESFRPAGGSFLRPSPAVPVDMAQGAAAAGKRDGEDTARTDKEDSPSEMVKVPLVQDSLSRLKHDRREHDRREKRHSGHSSSLFIKSRGSIFAICIGIVIGAFFASIAALIIWKSSIPDVVEWNEAWRYDGKVITVQGEIKEVYMTSKNNIYLYFSPGPDRSHTFRIGVFSENFERFNCTEQPEQYFKNEYLNAVVRMRGKVRIEKVANDDIPQMFATHPTDIQIIQHRPGRY